MFFVSEQKAIDRAREKFAGLIAEKAGTAAYDAVVCFSGGKDSTYTLLLAVKKYGLKVLALTLDNGFISDTAFANVRSALNSLNVDHITIKPAADFFNELIKISLLKDIYPTGTLVRISAGCQSCISLVHTAALRLALEKNIPFILAGFTFGQIPANAVIFKNNYQFLQESRAPVIQKLKHYLGPRVEDYLTLSDRLVQENTAYPHNVNPLCMEEISEDEILREVGVMGWQAPKDVDGCSSNCRLNSFNNFVHCRRFGFHPYELELSHLIRRGLLTRTVGLAKINQQPEEDLPVIMDRLRISPEELDQIQQKAFQQDTL